jgi:YD repeat-containing protein
VKYRLIVLFDVVAAVGLAQSQFTWDYSKTPVVSDSTGWNTNGSATFSSGGVTFSGAGGSLISTPGIPITNPTTNLSEPGTTSPDYDVVSTLTFGSGGGTWIQFLRANSNTVKSGSGTYVSVELVVPSGFTSPGAATLNIKQCVNGTLSSLGSVVLTAGDGMTLRTAIFGSSIFIFENKWLVWESGNVTVTSGNPGIGGYNMPSGTGFTSISLGHHDVLPPAQISATSFESSVFPNSVSLRWQGVLDDPNGVGVFQYWFARNGVGLTFLGAPEMTDAAVQPSTTYTYTVYAGDYDGNYGPGTSFTVTTPPAGAIDPRRTGISSTGSYWGGAGEQIDTLSGNLNFSIPLLTAQGRTGWTVPVSLVYNSQNWRSDNGVNWDLGDDVGFGYGWQMLIGSVVPFYTAYSGYPPDHYLYTDATGAQYRLDQNNGGVWTSSTQSVYVWLDTRVSPYRLHFPDGKFWVLGSTSGGEEPDGGSMYPTIIQDTFGNQVIVTYDTGLGLPFSETTSPQTWVVTQNTSSRIISIEDARAIFCDNAQNAIIPCNWNSGSTIGYTSYAFSYNRTGYSTPHLASYTNFIGTPELATGFTYTVVSQEPPFGADPHFGASVNLLTQVTIGATAPYVFGYDAGGAGEMTSAILPYGAELSWNYSSFEYIGTRSLREVSDRYLAPDALHATNPLWTYVITHPDAPNSVTVHSSTKVIDPSGVGVKTWNFTTAGSVWQLGLISQITQAVTAAGTPLQSDTYTWSQDPVGRPYISAKTSSIGQGTSNPQTRYSTQTLDQYGNVTQSVVYPYYNGTRGSAIRTYVNTYLSASNYTSNFIFNRLSTTTLDAGQGPFTIQSNQYDTAGCATAADGQSVCGGWTGAPTGPGREIGAGLPAGSQGALITTIGVKGSGTTYYHWGMIVSVNYDDGTTSTASADSPTNYAAPQSITVQNYNQTLSYSPWLGVTQTTGANGEQLQMTYDTYGRPLTATSPYGAVTNYAYQSASAGPPFWQSKTGPEGYTLTTLDGLGRVASVQRGATSTSIMSETDTIWMPYATAALGVVQQVSLPYTPGPSPSKYWTVTEYDALGRTLSVRKPDEASTTHYAYAGNQTTVTDPAGLWKQYTYDVLGNLVTVAEPDPLNQPGGTLTTTYAYDWMKHVTGVAMPRGATTQTRSFVYNNAGELTSATNPESGTTAYTYNPTGTVQSKLEATGQKTVYTYDAWNRVTNINYYYKLGASELPGNYRSVSFSYDTNSSWLPGWAQNTWGRLTQVLYYMSPATGGGYLASMQEAYSYTPSGAITKKAYGCGNGCHNLEFDWAYNTAGQISSVTYPVTNNSVLTNAEILT